MKRTLLAVASALLIACGGSPSPEDSTPTKPNFVLIFIDDMGYGDIGPFGSTLNRTPNLDRLAAEGVKLNNAISNCPVCTPARAMLVTGRHPQTTGHLINTTRTRHDEISIADAFANQGYDNRVKPVCLRKHRQER